MVFIYIHILYACLTTQDCFSRDYRYISLAPLNLQRTTFHNEIRGALFIAGKYSSHISIRLKRVKKGRTK